MSLVRFAMLCDFCEARSEEYSSWPRCRLCLCDCCPSCAQPGTYFEADLDSPESVICKLCCAHQEDEPGPGTIEGSRREKLRGRRLEGDGNENFNYRTNQ